jgi:hydroxymethylbilane synthase
LVIGSRGSDLALWQSHHIQSRLQAEFGIRTRIEVIRTQGDRVIDRPFVEIEGKGFFTKELEDALHDGRIDLAVHSLKDLPTEMVPDLTIAAIPGRADPRDVLLIARSHHDPHETTLELVRKARVGTSSVRRRAQLLELRPDLRVESLRGNVPTRIRRLREGMYDAILLAQAGVSRLELDVADLVALPLDAAQFVPAPGQGALAIQVRESDERTRGIVGRLHDPDTAAVVVAERSLLSRFGGGCSLPLGAHIAREADEYAIDVFYAPEEDAPAHRMHARGPDPLQLAEEAYAGIARGVRSEDFALRGTRVVVTREETPDDSLIAGLRHCGAEVIRFPTIRIVADTEPDLEARVLENLDAYDWVLFPSANAVAHFNERVTQAGRSLPPSARIGAIGPGTAHALRAIGREPDLVPTRSISESLLEAVRSREPNGGRRFLVPCAREGRTVLAEGLVAAGHHVDQLPVYQTTGPGSTARDPGSLTGADFILFASPSAVKHFTEITDVPAGARVVTIGPVTTAEANERGVTVFAEASPHTMEGMIACLKNG